VADFVDSLVEKCSQDAVGGKDGSDKDALIKKAEDFAHYIAETITVGDETLPGDPKALICEFAQLV
jgi:hypothetical protein